MWRHHFTKRRISIREGGPAFGSPVSITADEECRPASSPTDKPDDRSTKYDQGKGYMEHEYGDEGRCGERDHYVVLQRPPAYPNNSLEHHRQHGGLEPEEQARNHPNLAVERVDNAERHYGDEPGQDE